MTCGKMPVDDVREKIPVEGRISGEQLVQVEHGLCRGEFVEANLPGRDLAPFADAQGRVGVRTPFADLLEDHLQKSDRPLYRPPDRPLYRPSGGELALRASPARAPATSAQPHPNQDDVGK